MAIDIGSRLELMVDDFLIERMDGVQLKLHSPQRMPLPKSPLVTNGYATVIKDGDRYRAFYRGYRSDYPELPEDDGLPREIYCYAESDDGIEWRKPTLGLFEINGSRDNNAILVEAPFCHNFSPFLDTRPGVPADERYKALAGLDEEVYVRLRKLFPDEARYQPRDGQALGGVWTFVSPDGLHWRKWSDRPVLTLEHFGFEFAERLLLVGV